MNVRIGTVAAQYLSWEDLFRIFGIVSLQWALRNLANGGPVNLSLLMVNPLIVRASPLAEIH
jgi:hypothetical protein